MLPRLFTDSIFDDLFDDFNDFNNVDHKLYGKHANKEMLTNVKEHEDHYDVEIDLPGFKKEEINIELNNGYLTVSAAKGIEENNNNSHGKLIRQEKYYGSMSRSFYIGENIEAKDISAKHENGVLIISVPKVDETKQIESNHIMIE